MRRLMNRFLPMCSAAALVVAMTCLPGGTARAQQAAAAAEADTENAARLWSQNCGNCHNKRSPEKFSDAQWDVIVHHMRIRANLTGSDARAIAEFLKSAN